MKKIIAAALLLVSTSAFAEWKSDSEIGYVSQSGNAEQQNAFIKTNLVNTYSHGEAMFDGSYINASGETEGTSATLAESASAKLQYTYGPKENRISPFASLLWEKNRFAGFDNRYSGDLGVRFKIITSDTFKLYNETSFRYRQQFAHTVGSAEGEETESQFARIYFNLEKVLSKTSNFKFFIETLYDFSNSENVEVIFEPSLNVSVGEFFSTAERPAQVSINIAYRGIFDNVPAIEGFERYDSIFSTGLKVLY